MNIIITEKTRRGVAYLCVEGKKGLEPIGTVFFLDHPYGCHQPLTYAVTAQHCINGIKTEMYITFTDANGEYRQITTLRNEWDVSPTTDVACRLLSHKERQGIVRIDQVHAWVSPVKLIGAGYEVYIIGLFSKSPCGYLTGSVEPVVRFGRVARPLSTVSVCLDKSKGTEAFVPVSAYLIECISFGGESGSPVFICEDYTKDPNFLDNAEHQYGQRFPRNVTLTDEQVPTYLLGLVSAHWRIGEPLKVKRGKTVQEVGLNSGIAVVIPVTDILKFMIEDPKVEKRRNQIPKRQASEPTTPLSIQPTETVFTKDEFESALRKVSKRIQPSKSDGGKSQT